MNRVNIVISHLIWGITLMLSIIIGIGTFHNPADFILNTSIALFVAFISILFYSRAIFYSKKQLANIYSKKQLLANIMLQIIELLFIALLLAMAWHRVVVEKFSVFG